METTGARAVAAAVVARSGGALTNAPVRSECSWTPSPPPYSYFTKAGAQRVEVPTGGTVALKGATTYAAMSGTRGKGNVKKDGKELCCHSALATAMFPAGGEVVASTSGWDGTMPVGLRGMMTAAERLGMWKAAVTRLDQRVRWDATFRGKYLGVAVERVSRSSPAPMKKKGRAVAGGAAPVVQRQPSQISTAVPVAREGGAASEKVGDGRADVTKKRDDDGAENHILSENLLTVEEENRDEDMDASWVPRGYRAAGESPMRQWSEEDLIGFRGRGELKILGGGAYGEKTLAVMKIEGGRVGGFPSLSFRGGTRAQNSFCFSVMKFLSPQGTKVLLRYTGNHLTLCTGNVSEVYRGYG